ncbi:MAG TPA: hypothetical protein VMV27_02090 [Candidatus Binataceae bacterium]|nr:hypothetical protein [Candidatus Binataceae bacterium]
MPERVSDLVGRRALGMRFEILEDFAPDRFREVHAFAPDCFGMLLKDADQTGSDVAAAHDSNARRARNAGVGRDFHRPGESSPLRQK